LLLQQALLRHDKTASIQGSCGSAKPGAGQSSNKRKEAHVLDVSASEALLCSSALTSASWSSLFLCLARPVDTIATRNNHGHNMNA
jgi:hypothetical protein